MGDVPAPPAPTGLTGTPVSSTRIDLAWNDTAGEQGFKIERKLATETTWTQIAVTGQDVVTYSDLNSGLKPSTGYNYRVRGFTTGGNSGYSGTIKVTTSAPTVDPSDVVLYAANAPIKVGKYTVVADPGAAGGQRLENPDAGAATVTAPSPSPASYVEMSFTADGGVPYRLWIRGKARNNAGNNDSLWVQFNDAVTSASSTTPTYQIGTTSGTWVNLQDGSGATNLDWGWQDNGYGGFGPQIFFGSSGTHTLRIQPREDGFSIDQIVLSRSATTYLNASPGGQKGDTLILPEQNGVVAAPDVESPTAAVTDPTDGASFQGIVPVRATAADNVGVVRVEFRVDGKLTQTDTSAPYEFSWDSRPAANGPHTFAVRAYDGANNFGDSAVVTIQSDNPPSNDIVLFPSQTAQADIHGNWGIVSDTTAASGARMYGQNAGAAKVLDPSAPVNYFEMTLIPQPNLAYHLWLRLKSEANSPNNDSVYVQFSNAATDTSAPLYQIGTQSAASVILEDCNGCGISGWGWNDNGWGALGPDIYFNNNPGEPTTIRIQQREDGVSIDQIVLSSGTYLGSAPGALKNDNTKLP